MKRGLPVLALTQGDPAGIGPEILFRAAAAEADTRAHVSLLVMERRALESVAHMAPGFDLERLVHFERPPERAELAALGSGQVAILDPVGGGPTVVPGRSGSADAAGAVAAIDAALELAKDGTVDALVTAPISKSSISEQHLAGFVGHTDYLAERCGLERYGRDYLMAFLTPDLQVALLTTHLPLREAMDHVQEDTILEALICLHGHAPGRIAVAGLNPHAGEGGLLGAEDLREIAPAVARARNWGIDAHGPESADSLFARARRGAFDWVLSLYHDQGLIAVKTSAFGTATNWTLGLPILRTSVDHGTAFEIAGRGVADVSPLLEAIASTLKLLSGELPRSAKS
jgi:4-hydroxythreonine-4-phosphate dehydrogenase